MDYETFRMQLGQSPFISPYAGVIAWSIPTIELVAVALLIFHKSRLLGLHLSLFLMTLFSAYIYAMLHDSYYIPCSCGGVLGKLQWNDHLYFNLLFVALCLTGILLDTLPAKQANDSNVTLTATS